MNVLQGGDINVNDGGDLSVNDGGNITVNDGGNVTATDGGNITARDGGQIEVEDGGDLNVRDGGNAVVHEGGVITVDGDTPIHLRQVNVAGAPEAAIQLGAVANLIYGRDGAMVIQAVEELTITADAVRILGLETGTADKLLGVDSTGKLVLTTGGTGGGGGWLPDSYEMVSSTGETFTLARKNLEYARTIVGIAFDSTTEELGERLAAMCIMCAMVEAPPIQIYANSTIPESLTYPHDAVGSDGGSVGIYQQQPQYNWGTVQECMDIDYSTRAFIGGSSGPNAGNPPGIKDKAGWDTSSNWGAVVQSVQVSAYPERYEAWKQAAIDLVRMIRSSTGNGVYAWPFPLSLVTSEFGMRTLPDGSERFHAGIDFGKGIANVTGTPVPAIGAGVVTMIYTPSDGWHGWGYGVLLDHGNGLGSRYAHFYQLPDVQVGDHVELGQTLGGIGQTGGSDGNHLHLECIEAGSQINPRDFFAQYGS